MTEMLLLAIIFVILVTLALVGLGIGTGKIPDLIAGIQHRRREYRRKKGQH